MSWLVDNVVLHAKAITPHRLTAGAGIIVALFRGDNAAVALRQFLKTRITVPLVETLVDITPAVHAGNLALVFETDLFTYQFIEA